MLRPVTLLDGYLTTISKSCAKLNITYQLTLSEAFTVGGAFGG